MLTTLPGVTVTDPSHVAGSRSPTPSKTRNAVARGIGVNFAVRACE